MNNIKQCQNCQTEAHPGSGFCTNCGERLQEIPNCNSCGAELQPGWKACPECGNKVDGNQEAFNCRSCGAGLQPGWKACPECGNKGQAERESPSDITNSTVLIKQTDESKTIDRSVHFNENVASGPVTIGEKVNVTNVVNVDPNTVSRDEWETLTGKMNAPAESAGIQTTQSAEPLTSEQSELASEGRRKDGRNKVEKTSQQVGPDTGHPETYRRLGDEASNLGDYEDAIENYSRAINLDNRNSTAYNNRAATYMKMREYESAIQDLGEAIGLEPNDATQYSNRGAMYHTTGQYENAITDYGEAIRLKPSESNFYAFRALSYTALGYRWGEGEERGKQFELAIEDYVEAIRIEPNIVTNPNILFDYVCMAKAYQQIKQFEQAKKILDVKISRDPKDDYAYMTRASIHYQMGQPQLAMQDLEEAVRIDPQLATNEHLLSFKKTIAPPPAASWVRSSKSQWSKPPPDELLSMVNDIANDVIIWLASENVGKGDHHLLLTEEELVWITTPNVLNKEIASERYAAPYSAIKNIRRRKGIFTDHVVIDSGGILPSGKFRYLKWTHREDMDIVLKILGFHEDGS